MLLFTVYDSKSCIHTPPFTALTKADAMRRFGQSVNDKQNPSMISMYPQDFALFQVGEFDETTSEITSSTPINLGSGDQFLEHQQQIPSHNIAQAVKPVTKASKKKKKK